MNAPDKIYIGNHNENVQTGYFSRNKDYVFTQEYIRKDALLEWAKEQIKDYADSLPEEIGWDDALKAVINKINSL